MLIIHVEVDAGSAILHKKEMNLAMWEKHSNIFVLETDQVFLNGPEDLTFRDELSR